MIIANLNGGLGNQMFQYANAKAIAMRQGVHFLVDTSLYEKKQMHQGFELGKIFKLPVRVATKADLKQVLGTFQSPLAHRILARLPLLKSRPKKFIAEPHFEYWDGLNNCPNEAYLFGYWQSEKYFLAYEADIRREFTFQPFQDPSNIVLAQKIQDSQCAVSVHVRRGDFVSNPKANIYHGALSPSYYSDALALLARTLPTMELFVFSDDIGWVKDNLDLSAFKVHFVSHNTGINSYQDMALMSLCNHHVIANSSFSWWGAWLNASQDKIVIAPKRWFVQPMNTKDLIPAAWIRL
ncbi:alpha-1,2-fucosyltransferase [Polynucleobacter paneuropaeus]|jgi:hypothetical protein|nr:alpha-1,2-fucosyltransferase [Polynucleobacter paneuropaeus]QWD28797.1 alpha-1,2-fucosyltransferase [Polynucleobacter paneuropaeus]